MDGGPTSAQAPSRHDGGRPNSRRLRRYASLRVDTTLGFVITFRDHALEARYQEVALRARLQQDHMSHWMGIFPGIFVTASHWQILSWPGVIMSLMNSLFAPMLLHLTYRNKKLYIRHRKNILLFLVIHSMSLFLFLAPRDAPPSPKWSAVLGRVLFKSPVMVAFVAGVNSGLPFWDHLILQLSALPIFFMWAVFFCSSCQSDLDSTFQNMGITLEVSLTLTSSFVGGGNEFGCWEVVISIAFLAGVLIPIGVGHAVDIIGRKVFLAKNFGPSFTYNVRHDMYEGQLALWYYLFGVQLIWMALCAVGKHLF